MNDNQSLKKELGIGEAENLIDIKVSIGDKKSSPAQLKEQIKAVIKSDKEGLLSDFIDY